MARVTRIGGGILPDGSLVDSIAVTGGPTGLALHCLSRSGGRITTLQLGQDGTLNSGGSCVVEATGAGGQLSLLQGAGGQMAVFSGALSSVLRGYDLSGDERLTAPEVIRGIAAPGTLNALVSAEAGAGGTMVYTALQGQAGVGVWQLQDDMSLAAVQSVPLGQTGTAPVSDLALWHSGGRDWLLASDMEGEGLTLYARGEDGRLQISDRMAAATGLPVCDPAALAVGASGGQSYVVLAAAGSGSLSVLCESQGQLELVDHLLDNRYTRFAKARLVETVELGKRCYVLTAGSDDGISLLELLPDGRLVHLESFADGIDSGLTNATSLAAVVQNGQLSVFAGSGTEEGLTRIDIPLSADGRVVMGDAGHNTLQGGAGDDILYDGAGEDVMRGGAGRDLFVLEADGQVDRIEDFEQNMDRIDLSALPMVYDLSRLDFEEMRWGIRIGFGEDVLDIHSADGRSISAELFTKETTLGVDRPPLGLLGTPVFHGSDRDDVLNGTSEGDRIEAHGGPDRVFGMAGADTVLGGEGNDRIEGNTDDDRLFGEDGDDRILGGFGHDLIGGGAGRDWLGGWDGADTIYGGEGSDTLCGEAGNDHLFGEGGTDQVYGGGGADLIFGGRGADTLNGKEGQDSLYGGTEDDFMFGGNDADWVFGEGGNDVIHGQHGNDVMAGGAGNDLLAGGFGADTGYGGEGRDRLFGYDGDDLLFGGGGDDMLMGEAGHDRLYGEAGSDSLFGGAGRDELGGGAGRDLLLGDAGADRAFGGADADRLEGGGDADLLFGEAGNDSVFGQQGDDTLGGGPGDDLLHGGYGDDLLYGGAGQDLFIFNAADGNDTVADFEVGIDRLQISDQSYSVSFRDETAVFEFGEGNSLTLLGSDLSLSEVDRFLQ